MNQPTIKKQQIRSLIRAPEKTDILLSVLTLICQRADILGFYPFGCVLFAATAKPHTAYLYILAILAGSFSSGASVIKHFCASLIIYALKIFITKKENNKTIEALITTGSLLFCGTMETLIKGTYIVGFSMLMLEIIFAAISFPIFSNINSLLEKQRKNEPATKENAISLVVVIMVLLWGLSGITLPYSINIKTIISIYMILCLCMYQSFSTSATLTRL